MGIRLGSPAAEALVTVVLALCIIHGGMVNRQVYGRVAILSDDDRNSTVHDILRQRLN